MLRTVMLVASLALAGAAPPRVDVHADRSEAEAALAILDTLARGTEPSAADWQRLFTTPGYIRLKQREAEFKHSFTDADFQAFLRSPEAAAKAPGWHKALAAWSPDLAVQASARALAYVPADAKLHATIFPMIKPRANQFVYGIGSDPAIFLVLDPTVPPAKAANTMAHELNHIALGSVCLDPPASPDTHVAKLRHWVGAFGEGLAMIAAAGGPDVHPHADSPAAERAEWDANIARVDTLLAEQNAFFVAVLDGKAGDDAAIDARMIDYYGVQGPWYTVGWHMAQVIEHNLGRPRVIQAFCHAETLLQTYNEAAALEAARTGTAQARWDAHLAAALAQANGSNAGSG